MNLALRAVGLGFGYAADTRLFTDLDFEIPFGRVVGLTGRSGSGKSTLLYLLGLMLDPRAGHIEVDGIDTGAVRHRQVSASRPVLRFRVSGRRARSATFGPGQRTGTLPVPR